MGISLQAHPTREQQEVLSQWMGCARFIWNSKCDEEEYHRAFAKRYLPVGTYPPVDQKYSQYKSKELTPWLFDCPSQILRNSVSNWFNTYRDFLKGKCGRPKRKKKKDSGSIHLTSELFCFEKCKDGVTRLFIGSKTNNIGFLSIKNHGPYGEAKSIIIKRVNGRYTVSFCFEDALNESNFLEAKEHLKYLSKLSREELDKMTVGIDRGVKVPIQAGAVSFDFSKEQKRKKQAKEKYIKREQRRLAKQQKGSKKRRKRKRKISRAYKKIANIRKDFCHKSSRKIVDSEDTNIIVLEDLKTSNMTRAPAPKKEKDSKHWKKNGKKRKAGLNRSILDKGWHQLETYLKYKSQRVGKVVFKVPAHHTSQECAGCGHTHPDNRRSQALFICACCGHTDNADRNAAEVIKTRAINFILDSGTELSKNHVLLDSERGAVGKTLRANASSASCNEALKKKEQALVA